MKNDAALYRSRLELLQECLGLIPRNLIAFKRYHKLTQHLMGADGVFPLIAQRREADEFLDSIVNPLLKAEERSQAVRKYFSYGKSSGRPRIIDEVADIVVSAATEQNELRLLPGLPSTKYLFFKFIFLFHLGSSFLALFNIISYLYHCLFNIK